MRKTTLSEKLREERRRVLAELDELEAPAPKPEQPTTHLHETPRRRPKPLSPRAQAAANETIAEQGTAPGVIDGIMAQFRAAPLAPRRWGADSHLPRRDEEAS